jgi:beta-lactamase class A
MSHASHSLPSAFIPKTFSHKLHIVVTKKLIKSVVIAVGIFIAFFLAVNGALWAVQRGRMPLFLRSNNVNLGFRSTAEAQAMFASSIEAEQLRLIIGDQTYTVPAKQIGISADTQTTFQSITEPTGWNRLPVVQILHTKSKPLEAYYLVDEQKLRAFLKTITPPEAKEAKNATLVIPTEITKPAYIEPAVLGSYFDTERAVKDITSAVVNGQNLVIAVGQQIVQPKVTASELGSQLARANVLLRSRLNLKGTTTYTLTAQDMHSLITVQPNSDGKPTVAISEPKLVALLSAISLKFYQAPTAQHVTLFDGQVVTKTDGTAGQTLDIKAMVTTVSEAIYKGESELKVTMTSVNAATQYIKNYSHTSVGLAAFIKDFAATHSGTFRVATAELVGDRSAYYGQDSSTVPASTYKLFLAYAALYKIEQGQLSFSTQSSAGSVDYCIQRMIIVSDNTCAKALLDLIGWAETDSIIHAAGFTLTNLNNSGGGYMSTTAGNLAALLSGFYHYTLLNVSDTDYLLGLMKQQIYRSGIPAGSGGSTVADKVGFLDSWNHDAGIVYAPNATYLLVILTTSSNFSTIKSLASGIYDLYN